MKTKTENGIEYILKNDIWYPNLMTREEKIILGKYGRMRKEYLEKHRNRLFNALFLKEYLYGHCRETENHATEMSAYLIKQALTKGLDIIQASIYADEVVRNELIYSK